MKYNPKIHPFSHLAKAFLGELEFMLSGISHPKEELLVLNYHSTPTKLMSAFETQVLFFKRHFNIITPEELPEYFKNELPSDKPSLLFTFDDGLRNNLHALEILEKHQIKAFLFIVHDFIETTPVKQKQFYLENIRPEINPEIDSLEEDFTALSWEDLKILIKKGHAIGSHTSSHNLDSRMAIEESSYEIKESKVRIARKLNLKPEDIDCFCSPNNTLSSVGKKEAELIKMHYHFHFTTLPGNNFTNKNPLFIKRSNVECFWMDGAVKYAIGKWDRKRWKAKAKEYLARLS